MTNRARLASDADLVLFIERGRLAAAGTHDALLERADYRDLWAADEAAAA